MRPLNRRNCSCSYIVAIDGGTSSGELQSLAQYLSTLAVAGCEPLVVDSAPVEVFEARRRVLRWVARHVAANLDPAQVAAELATAEKIIVAAAETRYSAEAIRSMCELLDSHEVVQPEEYVAPLPWWGGVEAGGILLYRGADRPPQGRSTFGFRRSAWNQRLALLGAEVCEARQLFVRREPPSLVRWMRSRLADSAMPARNVFFTLLPLLVVLAAVGGMQVAAGYAGMVGFAAVALAARGRIGASRFFPVRACFFAPLWIVERSFAVYGALFARLRGSAAVAAGASAARAHQRAASGE